uniref:Large ribosomal subunit protein bL32c n=1 Tax=Dipteris conjugata TaxID=32108 RepID=A0A0B5ED66_9MONI|nr:ribosomal protein L32 [Dipteris conjugata]AXX76463.1 ribosomal protein L32 [Dipteris conjugata]
MAVPKKRTSRSRRKIRNHIWKTQTNEVASKAFSPAKSILTGRSRSFYYVTNEKISETGQ